MAPAAAEELLPLNRRHEPEKPHRIPRRVQRLIGYPIAVVLFAWLGYLMISHVRPDLFPPMFGGAQEERTQDDVQK